MILTRVPGSCSGPGRSGDRLVRVRHRSERVIGTSDTD